MLSVEISTIYKKGDRTPQGPSPDLRARLPDRRSASRAARADRQHRLRRPAHPRPRFARPAGDRTRSRSDAYLVPAHIWTPWFSALGSKSGFDSIAECYGDLAGHIFAVETGLSSDPAMNWRVSFLDRYRLISNSDAHSPGKLGREARCFDCDPDYFADPPRARDRATATSARCEFFPEEGKYHLDGHRKCGVRLSAEGDARAWRPLPGLRRAGDDRRRPSRRGRSPTGEAEAVPPPTAGASQSLVPLPEMLAELSTAALRRARSRAATTRRSPSSGPELAILEAVPVEDIARAGSACSPRRSHASAPAG